MNKDSGAVMPSAVTSQPASSEVPAQKLDVTTRPNEILFLIPMAFVTV